MIEKENVFDIWHKWFAWKPVTIRWNMKTIWLKTIERRFTGEEDYHGQLWEYRELSK